MGSWSLPKEFTSGFVHDETVKSNNRNFLKADSTWPTWSVNMNIQSCNILFLYYTCSITSGEPNDFDRSTNDFSFPSIIFSSKACTLLGVSAVTGTGAGGGGGGGGGGATFEILDEEDMLSERNVGTALP